MAFSHQKIEHKMKPYIVEFTVQTVILAEDENDAYASAISEWREIADDSDPTISVGREIKTLAQLPQGWDGMCLPYNGDGEMRLADILPAK